MPYPASAPLRGPPSRRPASPDFAFVLRPPSAGFAQQPPHPPPHPPRPATTPATVQLPASRSMRPSAPSPSLASRSRSRCLGSPDARTDLRDLGDITAVMPSAHLPCGRLEQGHLAPHSRRRNDHDFARSRARRLDRRGRRRPRPARPGDDGPDGHRPRRGPARTPRARSSARTLGRRDQHRRRRIPSSRPRATWTCATSEAAATRRSSTPERRAPSSPTSSWPRSRPSTTTTRATSTTSSSTRPINGYRNWGGPAPSSLYTPTADFRATFILSLVDSYSPPRTRGPSSRLQHQLPRRGSRPRRRRPPWPRSPRSSPSRTTSTSTAGSSAGPTTSTTACPASSTGRSATTS